MYTYRRRRWIGQVLKKNTGIITKDALRQRPEGKRRRGRQKQTQRRTDKAAWLYLGIHCEAGYRKTTPETICLPKRQKA